jgi:4-hydroxyphenylacetate 3-monooxygenase
MFYAGGQYVTRGHSYRTYDWGRATGLAKGVTDSYRLADFIGGSDQAA